jgi:hypothetical protein
VAQKTESSVADHEGGYTRNGLGMWSRNSAAAHDHYRGLDPTSKLPKRKHSAAGLLIESEDALIVLKNRLKVATGDKRIKLLRDADAKSNFIAKLKKEIEAQ